MPDRHPVIIFKKRPEHATSHGGAWKVAYADFVTAMMALFIVLWMMSASKEIKLAVGGYFKDPRGSSKMVGSNKTGAGVFVALKKDDLKDLKEELEKSIRRVDPLDKLKNQISMTVTDEGLRIELMEAPQGTFFQLGSATPTPELKVLLKVLSEQLGKLPNKVSIEGHTDSKPYSQHGSYDNWDLSTDRANAARRMMQELGIRNDQISQVRGYADQQLRLPLKPEDSSNRRITLVVQNVEPSAGEMAPMPVVSEQAEAAPASAQSPAPK